MLAIDYTLNRKCKQFAIKESNVKRLIAVIFLMIMLVACTPSKEADIVTTMFVQYDLSKQIVGNRMSVSLLIPPGAEIHGFQPSSRDIEAIKKAKIFIYTCIEMDSWIKDPKALAGENTIVIDLSKQFVLEPHDHSGNKKTEAKPAPLNYHRKIHDHDEDDIHYWTDPTTVMQLVDGIVNRVVNVDPDNEEYYRDNAKAYKEKIKTLHLEMDEYFGHFDDGKTIYFAGHNAMYAFAARYHINIVSLQDSYQPDADITSAQIQAMIEQIKAAKTNYLFIEELKEPKVANTIKAQLEKENFKLTLLELHGYHNVTKAQLEKRVSYVDLMKQNFENIKEALDGSI